MATKRRERTRKAEDGKAENKGRGISQEITEITEITERQKNDWAEK